jgi:flavin reductase (DIM6/NTAB) family NADH-FMN oxidoreductase RutF
VIGSFATGVAIVTTTDRGTPHGMTVNSLTSVSLDPLLLLVCLTSDSRTADAIAARRAFAVNVLGSHQSELSDRFAMPASDHFAHACYELDEEGLPLLRGAVAQIACGVRDLHASGDHVIVVGEVERASAHDGAPLIFHRGRYDELMGRGREAAFAWYW